MSEKGAIKTVRGLIPPLYFESALFVILSLAFGDPFCAVRACPFICRNLGCFVGELSLNS
jgi:hypothetical protein